MNIPPLPEPGNFVQSIRESSRSLRKSAQIQINTDSIKRLLLSSAFTSNFRRVSASHGLNLPLNFSSHLDEINVISILSLLNFASGYRTQLHAATGRGAWDSIRALALSLYLASSSSSDGDLLTSFGMQSVNISKISELMNVNVHIETPHPSIVGLTISELGGPLYELVSLVTRVLNETGTILNNLGYPNLGAFVLEALKEGQKAASDSPDAALEVVLERIVCAFPAFQDMAVVHGQPIYCFKKALFLIHALAIRFGPRSPAPIPIPPTQQSPIFADNVLPSLLVHLGIIDLQADVDLSALFPNINSTDLLGASPEVKPSADSTVEKKIPKTGPVVTEEQSYILRAAAVDACELIIEATRSLSLPGDGSLDWIRDITLPELDLWLWAVAKDRVDYRNLERFALKNTVFF